MSFSTTPAQPDANSGNPPPVNVAENKAPVSPEVTKLDGPPIHFNVPENKATTETSEPAPVVSQQPNFEHYLNQLREDQANQNQLLNSLAERLNQNNTAEDDDPYAAELNKVRSQVDNMNRQLSDFINYNFQENYKQQYKAAIQQGGITDVDLFNSFAVHTSQTTGITDPNMLVNMFNQKMASYNSPDYALQTLSKFPTHPGVIAYNNHVVNSYRNANPNGIPVSPQIPGGTYVSSMPSTPTSFTDDQTFKALMESTKPSI